MGNYSSVNKNQVSVELEKLELLKLINISKKNQVETLKKYIEKEARLIQELKEYIILLQNKKKCVICKYITPTNLCNKDTIII
tara:strand:+ start:225 stop:473 length:249 start_codon:yes stop_codon:yes gene_type:complete